MGKVYTVKEVAKKLNSSRNTVYGLLEKGAIKRISDTGRMIRVSEEEFQRFISNLSNEPVEANQGFNEDKIELISTHAGDIRKLKNENWYILKDLSRIIKVKDTHTIKCRVNQDSIKHISFEEGRLLGLRTNHTGILLITYEGIEEYSLKTRAELDWTKFLIDIRRVKGQQTAIDFDKEINEKPIELNGLTVIEQRELLGKQFKIYGDVENPLFLARDVAEWIEMDSSNASRMIKNIDADESITTRHNMTTATFLTEDGLYEVLMQSRKPIAKEFKKEVKAVLKQIRLTGGYVKRGQEEQFINNYFGSFSEETRRTMLNELNLKNDELFIQKEKIEKALISNNDLIKEIENSLKVS